MSVHSLLLLCGIPIIVVASTHCATARHTNVLSVMQSGREDLPMIRHDNDRLTAAQIAAMPGLSNAYTAIEQLRPHFFRLGPIARAENAHSQLPDVFINDVPIGGVETLRSIPVRLVSQIRFLRREDAYQRFGSIHPAGIILVTTKR
jgi:hypothetical protein